VGVGSESGERGAGSGSECESGEWGARLRGRRMGAAAVCDARDDDSSGAVGCKRNWPLIYIVNLNCLAESFVKQ